MAASSRLRSFAAALAYLPRTRAELLTLSRDHQALVAQVRRFEERSAELLQRTEHAEAIVAGLDAAVERLHATLVEADPRQALDIVTAVRDDVRALLVEVAEQANLQRDRAGASGAQG